jgi:hypothetical protein
MTPKNVALMVFVLLAVAMVGDVLSAWSWL